MARNLISVEGLVVEGDVIKSGTMYLPMRISEGKCSKVHVQELAVDMAGVEITQLLPYAGASIRIKVQGMRELGDKHVEEYFKNPTRKWSEVTQRQQVTIRKIKTVEDAEEALEDFNEDQIRALLAKMEARLKK